MDAGKRQFVELKKWMLENDIRQIDVARQADVSSTAVWLVMNRRMTSANIKNAFLELGCPSELLGETL